MPASSIEWRGGWLSRSSTLTPHDGATGRQAPVGSTSAALHGPAATTTAPAGSSPCGVRTPTARSSVDHRRGGDALADLRAGLAGAGGEGLGGRGGRDGAAGVEAEAGEVLGERGLELVRRVERLGGELREARGDLGADRLERGGVLAHDEHADGLRRQLEAVAELGVERLGRREDVRQRLVHRVLEQAGVAAGGAGGDLVALVEADARAVLGEEGGERAADDPAADDGDVRVCAHRGRLTSGHGSHRRGMDRPASPRRWASPRPTRPRWRRCSSSPRSPRTRPSAGRADRVLARGAAGDLAEASGSPSRSAERGFGPGQRLRIVDPDELPRVGLDGAAPSSASTRAPPPPAPARRGARAAPTARSGRGTPRPPARRRPSRRRAARSARG